MELAGKNWCEPSELSAVSLTVSGTNDVQKNPDKSATEEQIPACKIYIFKLRYWCMWNSYYLNAHTLKPAPGDRSGQICKLLELSLLFAITFMYWSKCFYVDKNVVEIRMLTA